MKKELSVKERIEMSKKIKGQVVGKQVDKKIKSRKSGAKFSKVNFNG